MRRVFWIALGATAGVLVARQVRRTASNLSAQLTPTALVETLSSALRDFGREVRLGMAEREAQLRSELGLDGSADVVDVHTIRDAQG